MLAKTPFQLDAERREELRHEWSILFKRFEKAQRACARSLSEKRVHALRLAGRHCLPVVEVLRALRPDEPVWKMTYHALRDALDVLGPLRDAQVRRLRLEAIQRKDRSVHALIARAKDEEKMARPHAQAAVAMLCALPGRSIKGREGRTLLHAMELGKALVLVHERRLKRLLDQWSAISMRRPTSLHKARVALKRYRYLLIALEPCLSEERRREMRNLEKIQGAIGQWHDEQLFMDWLKQAGRSGAQLVKRTRIRTAPLQALRPFLGKNKIA